MPTGQVQAHTLHDHPEYRSAAEAVGADGFLIKSELVRALRPTLVKLTARNTNGRGS